MQLYRKRFIPPECILLKDDAVVSRTDNTIITTWKSLNPKISFSHGCSCYYLKEGLKISKFYRHDNSLLYWYCDIVDYAYDPDTDTLTATDLLADVILYPDGHLKVVDLDELADALECGYITQEQLTQSLRRLQQLLTRIYRDKFDQLQAPLEALGL